MCGLAIESNTEGVGSGINNGIMFNGNPIYINRNNWVFYLSKQNEKPKSGKLIFLLKI